MEDIQNSTSSFILHPSSFPNHPSSFPPDWHLFAWQGIQLDIPRAWEINAVAGEQERGSLRLDDGEMMRVDARWMPGTKEPVAKTADRFLAALRKGRKGEQPDPNRGAFQVQIPGAEVETLSWSAGRIEIRGVAARCLRCGRVSLVRVFGKRDESEKGSVPHRRDAQHPPKGAPPAEKTPDPFSAWAARILSSFRDHAHEGRVPWSVLDFRFDVPEGYRLGRHSLETGRVELEFASGKCVAQALRVSLAQIVLRDKRLLDWFRKDPIGNFGRNAPDMREAARGEHKGIEVEGRERKFLRPFSSPRLIRCRAWHCAESNILLVARWTGPAGLESDFNLFSNSFRS